MIRVSVATLLILLFGTTKTTYVPVPCMHRMVIEDYGRCRRDGDRMSCPAASISFAVGCVSTKEDAASSQLSVTHPTAALVE